MSANGINVRQSLVAGAAVRGAERVLCVHLGLGGQLLVPLSDSMRTTGAGPDAPRREDPDAPFVRGAVMGSTLCIRFV
ncbi:hypothetical protein GGTG_07842 [Gaeumannomyces tritici R3-111a-1]|uniref:Uncharacterized protein n=1 Tax=Gaeumannomyces tritici (strain R3-111a-1) TaxID=644352 RepID=J3P2V0_GAET3|nr:hypothetical protein GGTG_07842 [Gaeumannomyces tritici R3-111a-1]EJT73992.1 hypothetical protein GGTG_07842 [Gaeumannomyces tritici R3-111a-1]